jgi:hypothetical protein
MRSARRPRLRRLGCSFAIIESDRLEAVFVLGLTMGSSAWTNAWGRSRILFTCSGCTPRCRVCRRLIAAGVPFVLEKPGAAAVADLAAVRDEAQAAGVPGRVPRARR